MNMEHTIIVILFVLLFIIVLSAIFLLYFFSEKNRVKSIKVFGNEILSDDYIIDNCGINKQDYLLLVTGFTVNKIDLIDNIKVTKNNGVVYLEVKEKKLVGYNDDNDKYTVYIDAKMGNAIGGSTALYNDNSAIVDRLLKDQEDVMVRE